MIRHAALAAAVIACGGCLEIERIVLDIDVAHHTARIAFITIGSSNGPDTAMSLGGDVEELATALHTGTAEGFDTYFAPLAIRWVSLAEPARVELHGARLDGTVGIAWQHLYEVGLSSGDAAHPLRYCSAVGDVKIAASNAIARDAHGCVLWGPGAAALHVELVQIERRHDPAAFVHAWQTSR